MDFSLTEEQQMFRDLFREFAEKEIAPIAEHSDREEQPPVELLKRAAAQGFLGATLPEAYGGAGMDYLTYTLLVEEIAKHCLSTAVTIGIHTVLASMSILDAGTEAQKRAYLPRLAGGELAAFALSEPDAGSDPGALQTRARRENGAFYLDGVKTWVSNGGLASVFVVFASTEPGRRHQGLSAFIVENGAPCVTVGHREPTLGLRSVDIRTIYFDDGHVPVENLLGPLNGGWPIVLRAFNRVRLSLAASALGAAEGALALGVKFAVERKQFGGPIAYKQAMQNYVADCAVEIEALRHLVRYAAWLADAGQEYGRYASMAKYFGARVAKETANKMLQVHGGYGFSDEYTISRIYRDVRALRLLGGTDEIQRYAVARGVFDEQGLKIQP
ncbi:MAG TPA: acyl-CoA dehydrogenase family protein [Anaerolineales bacterium]|nr:acyl-CoA dehydrogenase family protein [Anaerolineales bacterium]